MNRYTKKDLMVASECPQSMLLELRATLHSSVLCRERSAQRSLYCRDGHPQDVQLRLCNAHCAPIFCKENKMTNSIARPEASNCEEISGTNWIADFEGGCREHISFGMFAYFCRIF